jgi:DHA2 family multidrug resistance protein-like MFS transporter
MLETTPAERMEVPDGLPHRERVWAMVVVATGVAMAVLDSAIANVALPTIAKDLSATPAASVWVVSAYQLAVTVSLLPCSSLGDIYGHRRVYSAGLLIFTVASLLCAMAPTLPLLAAARVLQGFGGAGIMSVNGALIRFIFPRAMLGRGTGLSSLIVAIASAIGPTVAAGILSFGSWPLLFAVNVPLGILAISISRALPRTTTSGHRFDFASAGLNAATLGLFIIAVDGLGHDGTLLSVGLLAGAVAIGAVFVRRQRHLSAPMLPVDLFRRPIFALSVATSVTCFIAQGIAFVALPFLFQVGGGLSAIDTGLLMTPWPAVVMFAAPLAGRLSDRFSAGILGGIGLAALTAGLVLVVSLPIDAPYWDFAWRMGLCGFGFGFFQAPNNRILLSSAPRERSGAGSGMLSTARLVGQTTGAALVAVAFSVTASIGGNVATAARTAVFVAAGFAGCAAIVSSLRLVQRGA